MHVFITHTNHKIINIFVLMSFRGHLLFCISIIIIIIAMEEHNNIKDDEEREWRIGMRNGNGKWKMDCMHIYANYQMHIILHHIKRVWKWYAVRAWAQAFLIIIICFLFVSISAHYFCFFLHRYNIHSYPFEIGS